MPSLSNLPMSTSVSISNSEKKKKRSEKSDNLVKKLVFNCMECNINSQKCRLVLNVLMITTILSNVIELRLSDNTKFCKDNTKPRKKKLMNN